MPEAQKETPDYFLKLEGIEGESPDPKHAGELQLLHFNMRVSNRGRMADYGGGSKAVFEDVVCYMYADCAYPKLKLACATGENIPKGVLTCRKAGKSQHEYLRVNLTDLLITKCEITSGKHEAFGEEPVVEFSISFVKKQVEYREQRPDGSLGGSMMFMVDLKGKRSGN